MDSPFVLSWHVTLCWQAPPPHTQPDCATPLANSCTGAPSRPPGMAAPSSSPALGRHTAGAAATSCGLLLFILGGCLWLPSWSAASVTLAVQPKQSLINRRQTKNAFFDGFRACDVYIKQMYLCMCTCLPYAPHFAPFVPILTAPIGQGSSSSDQANAGIHQPAAQ